MENTNKAFYELWSREQLVKELCRINQLLEDSVEICKNVNKGINKDLLKANKVAFYKIVKSYYSQGTSSMSDWAFGDDGKYRDFKFIYSINRNDVNL